MAIVYNSKIKLYHIKGKYLSEDGKWKDYERFTGKNGFKEKKALKADEEFREKMRGNTSDKLKSTITLNDLWEEYRLEHKSQLKATTLACDESNLIVADKIVPGIRKFKIHLIKDKTMKSIIHHMEEKSYSLNYIKKLYTTLNKLLNYATRKEYIKDSPMRHNSMLKRPNKVSEDEIKFWTPEQFITLFNFLYFTGCRIGEAIALTWEEIDFDKNTIYIFKTCTQELKGIPYLITPPKTKNSVRKRKLIGLVIP